MYQVVHWVVLAYWTQLIYKVLFLKYTIFVHNFNINITCFHFSEHHVKFNEECDDDFEKQNSINIG